MLPGGVAQKENEMKKIELIWNLYKYEENRRVVPPVETYPEDWFSTQEEADERAQGLVPVLEARKPHQKLRFLVGYSNTHGGGSSINYFGIADEIEQKYPNLNLKHEYVVTTSIVATNNYGDVNHIDVYWVEK